MRPARSPRFQSDAERCSIAAISCGGLPSGIFGAEQAIDARSMTAYGVGRTICLLTWPAGASRRDAPAGVIANCVSGGGFSLVPFFFFPGFSLPLLLGPAFFLGVFFFLFFLSFALEMVVTPSFASTD